MSNKNLSAICFVPSNISYQVRWLMHCIVAWGMLISPLDYPLPPNEQKIEILRVVVRESMSMDLLDRLVSDIIAVTETLMSTQTTDLAALQPSATTIEKRHQSSGTDAKNRTRHMKRPMSHGVHRAVC